MVARYPVDVNDLSPARTDKFRRYRARKKAEGLREVRMWVPDLRNPDVRARLQREAEALAGAKSEQDALDWIEQVMADDPELYR